MHLPPPRIPVDPSARRPELLGRTTERRVLDRLLENVHGGQSGVLVVRGPEGVGKTALLDGAERRASGFRVLRVAGAEAELGLPFAALHRLCAPLLDRRDTLPAPQREALDVALGASAGADPDRFLVGLGVLALLADAAQERPLLCLVEDAQWLDDASAEVLGVVGRRLLAESVALVVAVRDPGPARWFEDLPELALDGLDRENACALLARAVAGPLDDRVRDRLVAETAGNPRALLEVPSTMSAAELAGGFDVPATAEGAGREQDHHLATLRALPAATQELALLAAADPAGDAPLVWRAADRLGIAPDALSAARDAGLLDVSDAVRFRHPLLRAAIYRAAPAAARRRVHGALAAVTDGDRGAWHRALAASGPDEAIAGALEQAAERARTRRGVAAAGALLERATALTLDPALRARRALRAAEAAQEAGGVERTRSLLSRADAGPLSDDEHSQVQIVRGRAALAAGDGGTAAALLLAAARGLAPEPAREAQLEALAAALAAGRTTDPLTVADVAGAAAAAAAAAAGRPQDLLLDGLARALTDGPAAGAAPLRRAVVAALTAGWSDAEAARWLAPAAWAAHAVWDDKAAAALGDRHVSLARRTGALAALPTALEARIGLHLLAGEVAAAGALIDELASVTRATGLARPAHGALALAALRGQESAVVAAQEAIRAEHGPDDQHLGIVRAAHAEALLLNGLGRYAEASAAAQRGVAGGAALGPAAWVLPELVEAAVRAGEPEIAEQALEQLARSTRAAGTDWALGMEARCRALLSEADAAEPAFREAIERLGRTRIRAEHARAQLLFGEWLRRQQRRVDARPHLRAALEAFGAMGMEAFAERARRELAATGETARRRQVQTRDELTAQELQIAHLARSGLTNPQIGEQLFLSPRTVEWHLRKVFFKLDITSRRGLPGALSAQPRSRGSWKTASTL